MMKIQWYLFFACVWVVFWHTPAQARETLYQFGEELPDSSLVVQNLVPGTTYRDQSVWAELGGAPYLTLAAGQIRSSVYMLVQQPESLSVLLYTRQPTLVKRLPSGEAVRPGRDETADVSTLQRLLLTEEQHIITEDYSQQYIYHTNLYSYLYQPYNGPAKTVGFYGLNVYGSTDGYQYASLEAKPLELRRVVGADGYSELYMERYEISLPAEIQYILLELRDVSAFYTQKGGSIPNIGENLSLVSAVLCDTYSPPVPSPTPAPSPEPTPAPAPTPTLTPAPTTAPARHYVRIERSDGESAVISPHLAQMAPDGDAPLLVDGETGSLPQDTPVIQTHQAVQQEGDMAALEEGGSDMEQPSKTMLDDYGEYVYAPAFRIWVYIGALLLVGLALYALLKKSKKDSESS